jgi:hypothetical protein
VETEAPEAEALRVEAEAEALRIFPHWSGQIMTRNVSMKEMKVQHYQRLPSKKIKMKMFKIRIYML